MKEYIVGIAIFVILMFFPLQWTINQVNHYKIQTVNNFVHNAAQKARTDGYFKEYNINELRMGIAVALDINQTQVRVNVTTTPKYRLDSFDIREMIQYEIGVPIEEVIAMQSFLGIEDEINGYEYIVKGEVPSELLIR
ncbi:MAG: hypothetical protein AB7V16_04465 [Vulcanibacillus sp.]